MLLHKGALIYIIGVRSLFTHPNMNVEDYTNLQESCRQYFEKDVEYPLEFAKLYGMKLSPLLREHVRIILFREAHYTGTKRSLAELIRTLLVKWTEEDSNQMLLLDFPPGPSEG